MAETKPEWMKTSAKEVEKLVVELAKEGNTPEKIGMILRDKHGIPKAKLVGKKISAILEENNLKFPDLKNIQEKRISALNSHITAHKHDTSAKRSLAKRMWVVHKLTAK